MKELDIYFNLFKPKYKTMEDEINIKNKCDYVNWIIHLNSILHLLTKDHYKYVLESCNVIELAANILNYISHFRHFTRKVYNLNSNFIILYDSKLIVSDFKEKIDKALQVCDIIIKYLPNVYLFKCNKFNSVNIKDLLIESHKTSTVLVTHAHSFFHYLINDVENIMNIIIPNSNHTKFYNYRNNIVNEFYLKDVKYKTDKVDNRYIDLIIAIKGDKKVGLQETSITSLKAVKILENLIDNGHEDIYFYPERFFEVNNDLIKTDEISIVTDNIKKLQNIQKENKEVLREIDSYYIDYVNDNQLMEITAKYFDKNPLDLVELFE